MKHPIQPLKLQNGFWQFQKNEVVVDLMQRSGLIMADLGVFGYDPEDLKQFVQLMGCKLNEYGSFPFVELKDADAALMNAIGPTQPQDLEARLRSRVEVLEKELDGLRADLLEPMARLYGVDKEDLA